MSGIQSLELGTVALKAKSREKLSQFYQEIMGLRIIEENDNEVRLGAKSDRVLLSISQLDNGEISQFQRTGLYHTAFLLPSRKDLANLLIHIIKTQYEVDGAGDHIYSEAIYFRDIEGNGIEIYADRPESEWQRDEAGNLPMATNEVAIENLIAQADDKNFQHIAEDTRIGHVHLQATAIEETEHFYQTILGLKLTTTIPTARFFAAGSYHHHIGSNIWSGRNLSPRLENETGLAYFTIHTPEYPEILNKLRENEYFITKTDEGFFTEDPNGIRIYIRK